MDRHAVHTLEYEKVLALIARYASSDSGRDGVLALQPLAEVAQVTERLRMISEMKLLSEWGKTAPLADAVDARRAVERARTPGAVLEAAVLLTVSQSARTARLAKVFFAENADRAPLLAGRASRLVTLQPLETAVEAAIDEDTNIRDSASPKMRKVRQEKARVTARISSSLQGFLAKEDLRQHLQDSLITIRSGRYVVPVRAEAKGKIAGIVHDTSQSGATVFIEPMETVELNNTLRSLELEEKDEILRILTDLTRAVAGAADALVSNMEILSGLDVILAAARFSIEFTCSEPSVNVDGRIVIRAGRHPILIETMRARGGGTVPLDISLGDGTRGVVITGPNAGGKTVALKTIGILTLMAKTGLHVPCGDGSTIALFDKVFVDIGDQQSIELSLSTFSSHMRNIIVVLAAADRGALILLDELGAGTDPAEGTALARAVIEELLGKGATLVATTHHTDLKVLAHENPLLVNASMDFDNRNLEPTYKLVQGVPGASHAFEIAARLGLGESTLERARAYCGGERVKLEDLTRDLLAKIKRIEEEEATAEAKQKRADEVLREYERKLEGIKAHEKELRRQALREARSIVEQAKRTAERVVSELKEFKAQRVEPRAAKAIEDQMREQAASLTDAIQEIEVVGPPRQPLLNVAVGSRAYVKPLSSEGVVIRGPDHRGRVEVAVGALKAEVGVGDLLEPDAAAPPRAAGVVRFEAKAVGQEIDVRGMTAEEAWELVDKYVDDAALCGLPFVRVIHGKGKGILARRITEMLASHPRVKSHRFGGPGEGGTGATVIDLERD